MLTSEFPPNLGGISYYVHNLSGKLIQHGYSVTVIARGTWRKSCHEKIEDISVYRVRFIPSYPSPFWLHSIWANRLFKSIESDFDLLHVHGSLVPFICTSLPIVYTSHGTVKRDIDNMPVKSFHFLMVKILGRQLFNTEKNLLYHADVITAVSQSCAGEIRRYHKLGREITVINPGVSTDYFVPTENKSMDNTYVLYTGRLETRKGLIDLIKAAKYVCQRYRNVKFVLTGKGTIEGYLKKTIKSLGLEENFYFAGYVGRDALLKYYQNAAIYVLPSYYEGLPATLLEAMSCGISSVATAVEGTSEVITDGKNGLLVPLKDPERLAKAILKLLANEKLRERIGTNARNHIKDNYDWQIITDRIEEIYRSVIT